jgi:hypothetical protein
LCSLAGVVWTRTRLGKVAIPDERQPSPVTAETVRLDETTASRLAALQAEVEREVGREVSQAELLARLVERAAASPSSVVDSSRDTPTELSDAELAAFNSGMVASGIEVDEDDVDDVLYD